MAVEAAALAASAIAIAVLLAAGRRPHDNLDAWFVVALAAFGAVALWWVWRGLGRQRRWARSPAVLVQLLALPISYNAFGDGAWWLAAPLLACAAVGLVGLFAPSTTDALVDVPAPATPPTSPSGARPRARRHSSTSKPSRS